MFQNQMYQQPMTGLNNAISGAINQYVTNMVRSGQIRQFDAQNLLSQAMQYSGHIISYLNDSATRRGDNAVHTSEVEAAVSDVMKQLLQSFQTQQSQISIAPQYNSFMQPSTPYQALQTGSVGMTNERSIQIQPPKPQLKVEPVVKEIKSEIDRKAFVKSISPVHNYTSIVDNDVAKYSMSSNSGPILSVIAKTKIVDETSDSYNYCDVAAHIAEPTLLQVIDNFINTNPLLCNGKYIANIRYSMFDLRSIKESPCKAIDLSSLSATNVHDMPADVSIQAVLDSITDRGFDIVSVLSELIIEKFNDRMDRYCRISTDVGRRINITEFKDLGTLASMRDRKNFGDLNFHKDYEDTVLKCFVDSIREIITEETKLGYYDAIDIASDLLTSPKFVIRKQGICERELDLANPEFIQEIRNKYTAYANNGSILVTNFIPDELEEDLEVGPIQIDGYTNPLDYITTSILRKETNTIIMKEGDRLLVVKCGRTMDGVNFIYRSSPSAIFV